KFNIPMGLGSQKIMIHDPKLRRLFDVKKVAPKVFLIGNIGAVSFNYSITLKNILQVIDDLALDAFALHLNVLQECIQPEGEKNFARLLDKIGELVGLSPVPIVIKEVGAGIAPQTVKKLVGVGVKAIDVGGKGGTNWSLIEGLRADPLGNRLGKLFAHWGLTTEKSLELCVQALKQEKSSVSLIATGGIRNGLHIAKAIAMGATMAGVGLPIFKAAAMPPSEKLSSLEAVEQEMLFFQKSLAISMFCSGAQNLSQLKFRILKGDLNVK
ncbi:MAG: alpha-hydroxy-acid oxidizing protein, partial [Silvanigrellaceae bacterium]|nr:alpha-hydroxy-acid oxidizing protein [Silvanigrellaceae bacterium]